MFTVTKRLADAFAGLLVGLGLAAILMGPAAMALVFPGQYAPRFFPTQQVAYERHVINITAANFQADTAQNICAFVAGTCSVRVGAVPYNAFLVRVQSQLLTVCNAATTCLFSLGTASGSANILAATSILTGVTTQLQSVAPAATGGGILVTGNNITATGANGGFDLYVTVTFTGAAPTTGTLVFAIEYFNPNDGGCVTNVAMASTAGPC